MDNAAGAVWDVYVGVLVHHETGMQLESTATAVNPNWLQLFSYTMEQAAISSETTVDIQNSFPVECSFKRRGSAVSWGGKDRWDKPPLLRTFLLSICIINEEQVSCIINSNVVLFNSLLDEHPCPNVAKDVQHSSFLLSQVVILYYGCIITSCCQIRGRYTGTGTTVWRTVCPPAVSLKAKHRGRGCLCPNRTICAHDPGGNAINNQRRSGQWVEASFRRSYHRLNELQQGHLISTRAGLTFCSQGCGQANRQLDLCLLHKSPHLTMKVTGYQQLDKLLWRDGFHRPSNYRLNWVIHRQSRLFYTSIRKENK